MRQLITHRDPWPEIAREFTSAVIIQRGSSITYELPNSYRIKYIPSTDQAQAQKKAYAFGVVRKEAADWMEAHEGVSAQVQKRKIIDLNESSLMQGTIRSGYYADVKGAYWNTAKNHGIVTQKTFDKLKNDKYIRNASIGALASKSHIYRWEKETGKKTFVETIEPPTAAAYWFISSFVAERMSFGLPYFLFFWVDCAYTETPEGISFLKSSFPPVFEFTEKQFSFVRFNAKDKTAFVKFPGQPEKPYFFERFKFQFFDV